MNKKRILSIGLALALACLTSAYAQSAPGVEQRFTQSIIVNGQQAQGVIVVQNGAIQNYTCASPQSYVTTEGSESGWACFDAATGTWLLHAQPPAQASTAYQQQPTVIYSQPSSTVYVPDPYYSSYYPYSYPYGYSYPFFVGPGFGLGFGFNRGPFFGNRHVIVGRPFAGSRVVVGGFRGGAFVGHGGFVGRGGFVSHGGGFAGRGGFVSHGGGFAGRGFGGGGGFHGGGRR